MTLQDNDQKHKEPQPTTNPTTHDIFQRHIQSNRPRYFGKTTRHHGDTGDESDLISKKNTTEQLSLSQCQNQSQRRLTSNKKILPFRFLLEQL